MSASTEWTPEPGEIVWLTEDNIKYKSIKQGLPDWAPNHLALVLYLTPHEDVDKRIAWLFPISSSRPQSDRRLPFIHFQYDYTPAVAQHDFKKCSPDCQKFLFLQPDPSTVPSMNKAGYVDTRFVYSLSFDFLKQHRQSGYKWQLRPCSLAYVLDMARDTIATHMEDWERYHQSPRSCDKLDSADLGERGLVCWVEPASKKITDVNGTSYTGSGPCVVFESDSETAEIYVMLDYRFVGPIVRTFPTLKADTETYTLPVASFKNALPAQCAAISLTWPAESLRNAFVSDQCLVLCPSFRVSIEDLRQLPSCFLPKGTRVSQDSILYAQDYTAIVGSSLNACAVRREGRDFEKNWLELTKGEIEKLKKAKKLKEAEELESKRQVLIRLRQNEKLQEEHEELLQEVQKVLAKVETGITSMMKVPTLVNSPRPRGQARIVRELDPRTGYLDWWEIEYLLCTTMARLKTDGPVFVSEKKPIITAAHEARSALKELIKKLDTACGTCPPLLEDREALRVMLGLPMDQCDTLTKILESLPRVKWADLMIEGAENSSEVSDSGSSISIETRDSSSEGTYEDHEDATQSSGTV